MSDADIVGQLRDMILNVATTPTDRKNALHKLECEVEAMGYRSGAEMVMNTLRTSPAPSVSP